MCVCLCTRWRWRQRQQRRIADWDAIIYRKLIDNRQKSLESSYLILKSNVKHAWHTHTHAILFHPCKKKKKIKKRMPLWWTLFLRLARMRKSFTHKCSNTHVYNIKIVSIFSYNLSSSNAFQSFFSTDFDYSRALFSDTIFFFTHLTPERFASACRFLFPSPSIPKQPIIR